MALKTNEQIDQKMQELCDDDLDQATGGSDIFRKLKEAARNVTLGKQGNNG